MSTDATNHTHATDPAHGVPDIPPLDVAPLRRLALIAAAAGLVLFGVLAGVNFANGHGVRDLFLTYLVAFVFWSAVPFGSLGLMMISYFTSASWGVVFRRIFQATTRSLWAVALLFVPVGVSVFMTPAETEHDGKTEMVDRSPFWWADPAWAEDESQAEIIAGQKKMREEAVEENMHKVHDYLNPPFFLARAAGILLVLGGFAFMLNRWARSSEDRGDEAARKNLYSVSGPGVIVWGLLLTFGVTDWVMSVEPTWASSMFPVVYGMNAFMCTFSVAVLAFYTLGGKDPVVLSIVKDKFRIDIGSLLFGFTMVWAYGTFCQYMLIWAANIPEEIIYFLKRGNGGWEYLAYFLMAFHWLVPFVLFLFRDNKRNPNRIRPLAVLLLIVGAADVIWWIVPAVTHEGWLVVPMAVAALAGVGGLWGLAFSYELGKRPILPRNKETGFLANWGHHGHADTPVGVH